MKRLLVILFLCATSLHAATTPIADTVPLANGVPATGTITITPVAAFTAADSTYVSAIPVTITLDDTGSFSISLEPSLSATSGQVAYTAAFNIAYGAQSVQYTETWLIPQSSTPVTIAQIHAISTAVPQYTLGQILPSQIHGGGGSPGSVLGYLNGTYSPLSVPSVLGFTPPPATTGSTVLKGNGSGGTLPAGVTDVVGLWSTGTGCGTGTNVLAVNGNCYSAGGLTDPGSNALIYRTGLNTTAPAVYGNVVGLWSTGGTGCGTGTNLLAVNGNCYGGGGLGDPGSNALVYRTALNTTVAATYPNVLAPFTNCSGIAHPASDGNCYTTGEININDYTDGNGNHAGTTATATVNTAAWNAAVAIAGPLGLKIHCQGGTNAAGSNSYQINGPILAPNFLKISGEGGTDSNGVGCELWQTNSAAPVIATVATVGGCCAGNIDLDHIRLRGGTDAVAVHGQPIPSATYVSGWNGTLTGGTCTLSGFNGGGFGATATMTIVSGAPSSTIVATNGGFSYSTPPTQAATITGTNCGTGPITLTVPLKIMVASYVSGGTLPSGNGSCTINTFDGGGSGAAGTVNVVAGVVANPLIQMSNNGSGYTSLPTQGQLSGTNCSGTALITPTMGSGVKCLTDATLDHVYMGGYSGAGFHMDGQSCIQRLNSNANVFNGGTNGVEIDNIGITNSYISMLYDKGSKYLGQSNSCFLFDSGGASNNISVEDFRCQDAGGIAISIMGFTSDDSFKNISFEATGQNDPSILVNGAYPAVSAGQGSAICSTSGAGSTSLVCSAGSYSRFQAGQTLTIAYGQTSSDFTTTIAPGGVSMNTFTLSAPVPLQVTNVEVTNASLPGILIAASPVTGVTPTRIDFYSGVLPTPNQTVGDQGFVSYALSNPNGAVIGMHGATNPNRPIYDPKVGISPNFIMDNPTMRTTAAVLTGALLPFGFRAWDGNLFMPVPYGGNPGLNGGHMFTMCGDGSGSGRCGSFGNYGPVHFGELSANGTRYLLSLLGNGTLCLGCNGNITGATTTGTTSSPSSTSLLLSNSTTALSFLNGATIVIAGGGVGGSIPFQTTIASGGGTVNLVTTAAIPTQVTGATVTTGYNLANIVIGSTSGGETGMNLNGASNTIVFNSGTCPTVATSGRGYLCYTGGVLTFFDGAGNTWPLTPSALATSSTVGLVKPDNSTITVSGSGVLTAVGAGISQLVTSPTPPGSTTGAMLLNTTQNAVQVSANGFTAQSVPLVSGVSMPFGDLACASGSDPTINAKAVTAATIAANAVLTIAANAVFVQGALVTLSGFGDAGWNTTTTVLASTSTTVTVAFASTGLTFTGAGTPLISLTCENTSDNPGGSGSSFTTQYTVGANQLAPGLKQVQFDTSFALFASTTQTGNFWNLNFQTTGGVRFWSTVNAVPSGGIGNYQFGSNIILTATPGAATTGTTTVANATAMTVASGTYLATGATITVAGGGATGGPFQTSITGGGGSTSLTVSPAIPTIVTNAAVTVAASATTNILTSGNGQWLPGSAASSAANAVTAISSPGTSISRIYAYYVGWTKTGAGGAVTYSSGGTVSGTTGQYCLATAAGTQNSGTAAAWLVPLSGSNSVSGTWTWVPGLPQENTGSGYTADPTSWTLSLPTANAASSIVPATSCSGTVTTTGAGTLVMPMGNALLLMMQRVMWPN